MRRPNWPSNTRYGGFGGGGIPRGDWHEVGGGESGFATPDPTDPNIVWSSASGSGARGGIVVRHDERNRQYRYVEVWPESTGGWPAAELRYRFQWVAPIALSPAKLVALVCAAQVLVQIGAFFWPALMPTSFASGPLKMRNGVQGCVVACVPYRL